MRCYTSGTWDVMLKMKVSAKCACVCARVCVCVWVRMLNYLTGNVSMGSSTLTIPKGPSISLRPPPTPVDKSPTP